MPTLSYSLTQTWDRPGTSDLEYWKYADLYDDEKIGAEALGITAPMWDCFINHYLGYWWEDLEELNVAQYYAILGWDIDSWDEELYVPETDDMYWDDLTSEQQEAAGQLCFSKELWDEVPLPDWKDSSSPPTRQPSMLPTLKPVTQKPTYLPSESPVTDSPSQPPTVSSFAVTELISTNSGTLPTPTPRPTRLNFGGGRRTSRPTFNPDGGLTASPTPVEAEGTSRSTTPRPTKRHFVGSNPPPTTNRPTSSPTSINDDGQGGETGNPSKQPTLPPSASPTSSPTLEQVEPTGSPSKQPTLSPSNKPSTDSPTKAQPLPICPNSYRLSMTSSYVAGTEVEVNYIIYKCKPYPFAYYCTLPDFQPDPYNELNNNSLWSDAWEFIGPCRHPSTSSSPTVNTDSPTVASPRTDKPTTSPSSSPTTVKPSSSPSTSPTSSPSTISPSESPNKAPTTDKPTDKPSTSPTTSPTVPPTQAPSKQPSSRSSKVPTSEPTSAPRTPLPTTSKASSAPTVDLPVNPAKERVPDKRFVSPITCDIISFCSHFH